jgi:hypothetical protein
MHKLVIDCQTGASEYVALTADEVASAEAFALEQESTRQAAIAKEEAETAARESARAKLAALGLTEAEVAALVK